MNNNFLYALYVFCSDYHSGQSSRLYRILSHLVSRYDPYLSDRAFYAIRTNSSYDWLEAAQYYSELKEKYSNDSK